MIMYGTTKQIKGFSFFSKFCLVLIPFIVKCVELNSSIRFLDPFEIYSYLCLYRTDVTILCGFSFVMLVEVMRYRAPGLEYKHSIKIQWEVASNN